MELRDAEQLAIELMKQFGIGTWRFEFDKGEGPDKRGNCFEYNAEHPPYEDTDYRCHTCKRKLGERDNECTR